MQVGIGGSANRSNFGSYVNVGLVWGRWSAEPCGKFQLTGTLWSVRRMGAYPLWPWGAMNLD